MIDELLKNFNRKGFKACYFNDAQSATNWLCQNIKNTSVGFGGSTTVGQLNLIELLGENNQVFAHAKDGPSAYQGARNAETYICSANAITKTGEIVNIDGRGNRVSATSYGAKRVFFVCGTNKITEDIQSAIYRAKNVAAPLNAKRLKRKTPCAIKGDKCYNCQSPERICNITTIITNPPFDMQVYIVLIEGNFGF